MVDNACVALSNISIAFASKPDLLEVLSNGGLISQALQLVSFQVVCGHSCVTSHSCAAHVTHTEV